MTRTAVLAGSTGLVGRLLLRDLLADGEYRQVIALSRQPLAERSPKLDNLVTDFSDLDRLVPRLAADDAYCCLGTTQAKAGRPGLERVDYQLVLEFARAAKKAGVRQFLVLSAAGASPRSPSFYSRTKARMERALLEVGFESLHILRPSLLLGPRSEPRPAEAAAQKLAPLLAPLFVGPLRRYAPIPAEAVAATMIELARRTQPGTHVHELPLAERSA